PQRLAGERREDIGGRLHGFDDRSAVAFREGSTHFGQLDENDIAEQLRRMRRNAHGRESPSSLSHSCSSVYFSNASSRYRAAQPRLYFSPPLPPKAVHRRARAPVPLAAEPRDDGPPRAQAD